MGGMRTQAGMFVLALAAAACGSQSREVDAGVPPVDAEVPRDAGPDAARWTPGCGPDSDEDGISDEDEVYPRGAGPFETRDQDADQVPNRLDTDSDGDGVLDRDESGDDDLCTPPRDCDRAAEYCSVPQAEDFLDPDSEDDAVPDGQEVALGLDGCAHDTDADGCPDVAVAELGGCAAGEGDVFVVVPCQSSVVSTQITHVVPADLGGIRERVELHIEALPPRVWSPSDDVTIELQAAEARPAGSAVPDGEGFRDVMPGAELVFEVTISGGRYSSHCSWQTVWAALRLRSDQDELLTDRRIALTIEICTELI